MLTIKKRDSILCRQSNKAAAMTNIKKTTINLDELERESPLSMDELIYRELLGKLNIKIKEKALENVKKIKHDDNVTLANLPCFFINGKRGSGKTTIVRSLQNNLNRIEDIKLRMLASIDPTCFGEEESFFIYVLGCVQKKFQEIKYNCNESKRALLKKAYDCLQKMSRGLSILIRNPQSLGQYEDTNYLVQECISESISSSTLKEEFADIIEYLCEVFEVDAWVVTIDDADTVLIKCKEILETVRKYLLTPRMIFVFAGDLQLYSTAVRGMHLDNFEETQLKYDNNRIEQIFNFIDSLEEQYIMKLFPPENRLTLYGFEEVMKLNPYIKSKYLSEETSLLDLIKRFNLFYIKNNSYSINDYLRLLTTRSALQLLSYWASEYSDESNNSPDMIRFCEGIHMIVAHSFIKCGIEYDNAGENSRTKLLKAVLIHAKKISLGAEGARLIPGIGNKSTQLVSFYLSSEVYRQIRNTSDALYYMLNVFPYLQRYGSDDATSEKVLYHLNASSARQSGYYCTNAVYGLSKRTEKQFKPFANGIIPLLANDYKGKSLDIERISVDNFIIKLIDEVRKNKTEDNLLVYVAVYHCISQCNINGVDTLCLSIYNLLFTIQKLLDNNDKVSDTEWIKTIITEKNPVNYGNDYNNTDCYRNNDNLVQFLIELRTDPVFLNVLREFMKWKQNIDHIKCDSNVLHSCWKEFLQQCSFVTESAMVRAISSENLVNAADLFKSYMESFVYSLVKYLGERYPDYKLVFDECPLWKVLVNLSKYNSNIYHLLHNVNIAPVDLTYDSKKIKILLQERINQTKEKLTRRVHGFLLMICEESEKRFEQWWDRNLEELKLNYTNEYLNEKKINFNRRYILMIRLQAYVDEFIEIIKNRKIIFDNIIKNKLNDLKNNYKKDVDNVINIAMKDLHEQILDSLYDIDREDTALIKIEVALRKFEKNNSFFREKVQGPMVSKAQEVEERVMRVVDYYSKKLWKRTLQKFESNNN